MLTSLPGYDAAKETPPDESSLNVYSCDGCQREGEEYWTLGKRRFAHLGCAFMAAAVELEEGLRSENYRIQEQATELVVVAMARRREDLARWIRTLEPRTDTVLTVLRLALTWAAGPQRTAIERAISAVKAVGAL